MKTMVIVQPSEPGLLAEVTGVLARKAITLKDISGHVVGSTAVISLLTDPYHDGYQALSEAGYAVYASETLLVRLAEKPGALARLSRQLADADVDVRGLHIVNQDDRSAIVAIETANQDRAREVLKDQLLG